VFIYSAGYAKFTQHELPKILQYFYLATLLAAVLLLWVILPWRGFAFLDVEIKEGVVMFYIVLIAVAIIGKKWMKWFPWYRWYPSKDIGVLMSHSFWAALFEIPVGLGFFLGLLGASWWGVIPFFAVGGIGLILTFPTDKRVDEWKKIQPRKPGKTRR
jgi:hypothetical protein